MNVVENRKLRERIHVFKDREHAGILLSEKLSDYVDKDTIVLAIPMGGIPVGKVITKQLNVNFDLIMVRKIQIPWNTEAGFGAVASDGTVILNEELIPQIGLSENEVQKCVEKTKNEVFRRIKKFRQNKPPIKIESRNIILVDDGLASGFTMLTAIKAVKNHKPKKIYIAVPTASESAIMLVSPQVDNLICLNLRSGPFFAVADAYEEWYDLDDKEALDVLLNDT
jgi:predicted phosphoribosyltransferase